MSGTEGRATAMRAAGFAVLAWAAELLLARATFDRQDPLDIVVSLAGWALAFALWSVARGVPGARGLFYGNAILLALLGTVTGRACAAPLAAGHPGLARMAVLGGAMLGVLVAALLARRRSGAPPPSLAIAAWTVASALALAARDQRLGSWVEGDTVHVGMGGAAPPIAVVATVLASWLAATILVRRPGGMAFVVAATTAFALTPARPDPPRWTASGAVPEGPDILLVSIDTLRADDAASMRSMQRLAASGTTFTAAQATAPWTLPSMASVMTGVDPAEHGAFRGTEQGFGAIGAELPTLAESLAASGWDTAAVLSPNAFVGTGFGFHRGFAHFDHAMERAGYAQPLAVGDVLSRPFLPEALMRAGLIGRRSFADADELGRRALDVIARRRERPLFLWVHYLDCHFPYRHGDRAPIPWPAYLALSVPDKEPEGGLFPDEVLRAGYRHEIARIDDALERLLDALGPPPPRGRVVLLTSDHGEAFGEHGGHWHGHALYQEVAHVPLVVSGIRGPSRVDTPVSIADVAATLARAADVAWDAKQHGLPALEDGPAEVDRPLRTWNLLMGPPMSQAVRRGRWKLVLGPRPVPELYDLDEDPAESRNLADSHPGLVRELTLPLEPAARAGRTLSADERRMLEALGYLQE